MGMKVGVCGAGQFASCFIPLFKAHPAVEQVAIAEVFPERRREQARHFEVSRTFASLDELCSSDVDAIALFSQRWMHGPQAIQALEAGKHVYSAVPTGVTLEELDGLVQTVKKTGLTYMLGETSYYYPSTIYCRTRFKDGDFGDFVYGEGEYLHEMSHGFYEAYQHSGGDEWKKTASFPPMLYPTHSVSMISSVTGARMVQVSCLGYVDKEDDGVFRKEVSMWENEFSNQTALFRTSDGGMCRINEFRRVGYSGARSVRLSVYGTEGSYEEQASGDVWSTKDRKKGITNLTDFLACKKFTMTDAEKTGVHRKPEEDVFMETSPVHSVERLPEEFKGLRNGHNGSHQFLVDDFVKACVSGKLPPNHVWAAARYCAPGIVAHESAKREGELMKVPDFGEPQGEVAGDPSFAVTR